MGLTNLAMDIVVNKALIEKSCTQLTLNNNKFTQDGALSLATALKNNTVRDIVRFLFRFLYLPSLSQRIPILNIVLNLAICRHRTH